MRIRYYLIIISILLVILLIVAKKLYHFSVLTYIKSFFYQPSHPVNLSIFRIVLFSLIFTQINLDHLLWFSNVPKELIFPPKIFFWSLDFLKINESWIRISYWIFCVTCIMSILGLFTRLSIFVTTIFAFYLLAIPNFFGKVDHNHQQLVLVATIMTVSRCSDVWSVDALLKSRKSEYMPGPSILYGVPVRIIWLLFGILYFFPGFWKVYDGGLGWIFSDNLKFLMYEIWFSFGWVPFFRLDNYPLLIKMSALLTVLFETSFIFFLFFGRLRYVVIIGGLIFHCLTYVFLKINFISLQICYVIFFDFAFLYNWYIRLLPKKTYSFPSGLFNETKQFPYATVLVGGFLILGNVYAGLTDYPDSWYFSCYPTFQGVITKPVTTIMSIQIDFGDGKYKEIDADILKEISDRFGGRFPDISNRIAKSNDHKLFVAYWNFIKKANPSLQRVTGVKMYEYKVSTVPGEKLNEPIEKKLLFEYHNSNNVIL